MIKFVNPVLLAVYAEITSFKEPKSDPFKILSESNTVTTELGIEGTSQFSFAEIGFLLQNIVFYGGLVTVIGVGILLLFTKGNEKTYTERKQQIIHKLFLIWLAASAVTLFNFLKMILDGVFGF